MVLERDPGMIGVQLLKISFMNMLKTFQSFQNDISPYISAAFPNFTENLKPVRILYSQNNQNWIPLVFQFSLALLS